MVSSKWSQKKWIIKSESKSYYSLRDFSTNLSLFEKECRIVLSVHIFMSSSFSGKYAMKQLVAKLPSESNQQDFPTSDQTITAVQATLYEVIKNNPPFIL